MLAGVTWAVLVVLMPEADVLDVSSLAYCARSIAV